MNVIEMAVAMLIALIVNDCIRDIRQQYLMKRFMNGRERFDRREKDE